MRTVSIDLSNINSMYELHDLLKCKLGFPDFYGMNWDAFWDSIIRQVQMPDELEIIGLEDFSKVFPADAKIFIECLNDYNTNEELIDLKKLKIVYK